MSKYHLPLPNSDKLLLINEWIDNERDRQINTDWHLNGMTQEAIAEKHRLTPRRVQQIIRESYRRMADGLDI